MSNLKKQIVSFSIGIIFNLLMLLWIIPVTEFLMNKLNITDFGILISQVCTSIISLSYFGIYGLRKQDPVHEGVLLILDEISKWFTLPAGHFWILPSPFMDFISLSLKEKTKDMPIKKVLSSDGIEAEMEVQFQFRIIDSLANVQIDEPEKALEGLADRNIRWLANTITIDKMPGVKSLFSQVLEGKIDLQGLQNHGDVDNDKLGDEDFDVFVEIAEKWGYKILKAMIKDIRIPQKIIDANIEKITEEAQVVSETTQHNHFLKMLGGGFLKEGKKIWEGMSGPERAKIIQAERGKRQVFTVDGDAGDFTKGGVAGALASKGGKNK